MSCFLQVCMSGIALDTYMMILSLSSPSPPPSLPLEKCSSTHLRILISLSDVYSDVWSQVEPLHRSAALQSCPATP